MMRIRQTSSNDSLKDMSIGGTATAATTSFTLDELSKHSKRKKQRAKRFYTKILTISTFILYVFFIMGTGGGDEAGEEGSRYKKEMQVKVVVNKNPNPTLLWRGEAKTHHLIHKNNGDGNGNVNGNGDEETTTRKIQTIELAIAYCNKDLNWMFKDVLGEITADRATAVKMTIISKCGNENLIPDFGKDERVQEVKVISLPNVGGCDLAYAYFMNRYIESHTMEEALSSVILFIKDTPRIRKNFHFPFHKGYRTVGEMIDIASSNGNFICGVRTNCEVSPFHTTDILYQWAISRYQRKTERVAGVEAVQVDDFNLHAYSNLKDFHTRALNWTFPNQDVTSVCYGGTFGVAASRLIALSNQPRERKVFPLLEDLLTRKSSLNMTIEEHFAERTWGGLLSYPLTGEQTEVILKIHDGKGHVKRQSSVMGALRAPKNNSTCPP